MSVENPKLSPEQFRINRASENIRAMADEMKDELKPATRGLEPALRRLAEIVSDMTVAAPLQSLAIAFLLGILLARRR